MKVDIANRVLNDAELDKSIRKFEVVWSTNAYLFMSESTAAALSSPTSLKPNCCGGTQGVLCMYKGSKVFMDNDLDFGVVDIR